MPSPFPGMDPYLEQRMLWPDLHQRLIAYSAETLQAQLRPNYVVRIGERVEVAGVARTIIPDVLIVKPTPEPPSGPTAGSLVADEPITVTVLDEERRVPFLEIIDPATHAVITLIEVLSPANKSGDGREQYLQKQQELLASQVHFVEIDLLGYGTPTVLARNSLSSAPPGWRYLIDISRADRRQALELYAVRLQDRLPRCRIPLHSPDPDAVLDLPAVFTRCYDAGGYDLLIDYRQPPDTLLSDEEARWTDQWLRENQLR